MGACGAVVAVDKFEVAVSVVVPKVVCVAVGGATVAVETFGSVVDVDDGLSLIHIS